MSKREASQIAAAAGVDIDAPRAKRRREVPASTDNSGVKAEHASPGSNDISKPKTEGEDDKGIKEDPELVKEKGLKLWQTVKDAVNKECVTVRLKLTALFLTPMATLELDHSPTPCIRTTNCMQCLCDNITWALQGQATIA